MEEEPTYAEVITEDYKPDEPRVFLPVQVMTERELAEETLERLRNIDDAFRSFSQMDLSSMMSGLFSGGNAKGALKAALGRKKNADPNA